MGWWVAGRRRPGLPASPPVHSTNRCCAPQAAASSSRTDAPPPHQPAMHAGNFACPSIVEWSDDTVKVVYTVWGEGVRLATIKLATVDS